MLETLCSLFFARSFVSLACLFGNDWYAGNSRDICCSLSLIEKNIPCFLKIRHRVPLFLQAPWEEEGGVNLLYDNA